MQAPRRLAAGRRSSRYLARAQADDDSRAAGCPEACCRRDWSPYKLAPNERMFPNSRRSPQSTGTTAAMPGSGILELQHSILQADWCNRTEIDVASRGLEGHLAEVCSHIAVSGSCWAELAPFEAGRPSKGGCQLRQPSTNNAIERQEPMNECSWSVAAM
jgi:hypothetical protein